MSDRTESQLAARVWAALEQVHDPEIPAISIVDLGVVRAVEEQDGGVEVSISPTYSGCPAIEQIERDAAAAAQRVVGPEALVRIRRVLAPAWTTDWMTDRGRARLRAAGIAPPQPIRAAHAPSTLLAVLDDTQAAPRCPRCASGEVERISEFGSTACKALWRCQKCREPFDYFKAH